MSGFQSARRASAVAALTLWLLLDSGAVANQPSQVIAPAQQDLLIRSYRRCVDIGPQRHQSADDAALLASAYPFDVDALSLLKNSDIERAPRERVEGTNYLTCEWFGFRRSQVRNRAKERTTEGRIPSRRKSSELRRRSTHALSLLRIGVYHACTRGDPCSSWFE